jgi:3-oxoacyl-(acyl-carrier-protein) synthase
LKEGRIPATLNHDRSDECVDGDLLRIVAGTGRVQGGSGVPRAVLKNSFGFGGTNVSLLLSELEP